MIGPLGYLFAFCAVILAVALYRTQNTAAHRERALESQIKALRDVLEVYQSSPERLIRERPVLSGTSGRYGRFSKTTGPQGVLK